VEGHAGISKYLKYKRGQACAEKTLEKSQLGLKCLKLKRMTTKRSVLADKGQEKEKRVSGAEPG